LRNWAKAFGAVQDQAAALKVDGAVAKFQQFVQLQVFDSHDAPSISI